MPATREAYEIKALKICTERLEFLDKVLDGFITENKSHAFVVRAHRYGIPIYEAQVGETPSSYGVRQDSISRFFSITKPIIGALFMKLQEDALVDLVEPVRTFIPSFTDKDDICIWHLLTHTSGIDDGSYYEHRNNIIKKVFNLKEPEDEASDDEWREFNNKLKCKLGLSEDAKDKDITYRFFESFKPKYKPREIMTYCNTGFQLLGNIITEVTNKSIDEYAHEVMFEPLKMVDSHFVLPKEKWNRYLLRKEGGMCYPWINSEDALTTGNGAGGLKSTVIDMCRFGDMIIFNGTLDGIRFLSPVSIKSMIDNHNSDMKLAWDSWGLGWNYHGIKKDDAGILRSDRCVEHGGYAGHKILVDPEYGLSISVIKGEWDPPGRNPFGHINNVMYSALD